MADTESSGRVSKLPLLIMGVTVFVAVLLTIALIAFRGAKTYEPGTPEATLQDFIQAGLDDDEAAMMGLLTDEARERCRADFDARTPFPSFSYGRGLRAEIDSVRLTDDSAIIEVVFRQSNSNDPFDRSGRSFEQRYSLANVGDEWQIERAGWPNQFVRCTSEQG